MALFKWFARTDLDNLVEALGGIVEAFGLVVNQEVSSAHQLYASDQQHLRLSNAERVKLIATWSDQARGEILIEVRSDEPLLRPGSRCELLAQQMKSKLQSI